MPIHTRRALFAVLALGLAAQPLAGQSTWTGGGTDSFWNTPANWSGGTPASGSATAVTFAGSTRLTPNQNIASPFILNSLTFDPTAGAFVLGGSGLSFALNGSTLPTLTQSSASNVSINEALTLGS